MKFTEEHEWLRVEGDEIVVGITIHAAEQLGDVVFVELPDEGTTVSKDDEVVVIEIRQGRVRHSGTDRWRDHRGQQHAVRQPRDGE
ncbi:hypothetical protein Sulfitobl28_07400 [Sulfitobacter pontiacus]|nr:hypothetical protein Sulfitobl28_07400 [Sulfitobacter pontiacus]